MMANGQTPKAGLASSIILMQMMVAGLLMIFAIDAGVIYLLGMIPTMAMALQKPAPYLRSKVRIVLFCNMATVIPWVKHLLVTNESVSDVVAQISPWIIMFSGAAAGYAVITIGPMIAAAVIQTMAGERLRNLAKQRQKLIEEWGPDVASSAAGSAKKSKSR